MRFKSPAKEGIFRISLWIAWILLTGESAETVENDKCNYMKNFLGFLANVSSTGNGYNLDYTALP